MFPLISTSEKGLMPLANVSINTAHTHILQKFSELG